MLTQKEIIYKDFLLNHYDPIIEYNLQRNIRVFKNVKLYYKNINTGITWDCDEINIYCMINTEKLRNFINKYGYVNLITEPKAYLKYSN